MQRQSRIANTACILVKKDKINTYLLSVTITTQFSTEHQEIEQLHFACLPGRDKVNVKLVADRIPLDYRNSVFSRKYY